MKKLLVFFFVLIALNSVKGQGLEGIIVEKYYISDTQDSIASGGILAVGSVTYRIYVDMKKGYKLQAVYGIPGHPMEIATSTYFYNDEDRGGLTANAIHKKDTYSGTVLLDSYLSMGAASDGNFAVVKNQDADAYYTNKDGALKNEDPAAGIPISKADGLSPASPIAEVVFYGIDSTMMDLFKRNKRADGQRLYTDNGSWAAMYGNAGLDTNNVVLIAQLTTTGQLSFKLNLQMAMVGNPPENFVAEKVMDTDFQFDGLIYPKPSGSIKSSRSRKNND